jgi:hypothetical protein
MRVLPGLRSDQTNFFIDGSKKGWKIRRTRNRFSTRSRRSHASEGDAPPGEPVPGRRRREGSRPAPGESPLQMRGLPSRTGHIGPMWLSCMNRRRFSDKKSLISDTTSGSNPPERSPAAARPITHLTGGQPLRPPIPICFGTILGLFNNYMTILYHNSYILEKC